MMNDGFFDSVIDVEIGELPFANAWLLHREKLVKGSGLRTALVAGSVVQFGAKHLSHKDDLLNVAAAVGQTLAEAGWNVLTGGGPGVPSKAVLAFNSISPREGSSISLSAYETPNVHREAKAFYTEGFPIDSDATLFLGTGFEILNVLNTQCVDLVVAIGGGLGTMLEVFSAVERGIPVICIDSTGGAASETPNLVRKFAADFKHADIEEVDVGDFFKNLLEHKKNPDATDLISQLNERPEHVSYHIDLDKNKLVYKFRDKKIEVPDPVLMNDKSKIALEGHEGEIVSEAIDTRPRYYYFDGVEIEMSGRDVSDIWGPNIDAYLLCQFLKREVLSEGTDRILDVGTGSGLLAIWAAHQFPKSNVTGIDINPKSRKRFEFNQSKNRKVVNVDYIETAFKGISFEKKYDLIITNPPYLPADLFISENDAIPGRDEPLQDSHTGLDLIAEILKDYQGHLSKDGKLFMTISSATQRDRAIDSTLKNLEERGVCKLHNVKKIPLKIDSLVASGLRERKNGNLKLEYRRKEHYPFWHKIIIVELSTK